MQCEIHDLIAQREESFRGQWFSEEVGDVLIRLNVRNHQVAGLNQFTNVEMPPFDMFRTGVVLRIVGKITGTFVVLEELEGRTVGNAELLGESLKKDGFLGCLRGSHDLSFAARKSDGSLAF